MDRHSNTLITRGPDLAGLDRRSEDNGVLTGWATLTGVWSDHELHVRHQGLPVERPNPTGRRHTPPRPLRQDQRPELDQARSRLHDEMRSGRWPLTMLDLDVWLTPAVRSSPTPGSPG